MDTKRMKLEAGAKTVFENKDRILSRVACEMVGSAGFMCFCVSYDGESIGISNHIIGAMPLDVACKHLKMFVEKHTANARPDSSNN